MEAEIGPVVVACDRAEDRRRACEDAGGAGGADPRRPSLGLGPDFRGARTVDPRGPRTTIVVNLQGDLPTIDPGDRRAPRSSRSPIRPSISRTLAAEIDDAGRARQPQRGQGGRLAVADRRRLRALYFTRATAPSGDGPLYHHIGLYAYRRAALARFVGLPPSPLETARAARAAARARGRHAHRRRRSSTAVPLGVDTPEDLERARAAARARTVDPRPSERTGIIRMI